MKMVTKNWYDNYISKKVFCKTSLAFNMNQKSIFCVKTLMLQNKFSMLKIVMVCKMSLHLWVQVYFPRNIMLNSLSSNKSLKNLFFVITIEDAKLAIIQFNCESNHFNLWKTMNKFSEILLWNCNELQSKKYLMEKCCNFGITTTLSIPWNISVTFSIDRW